MLVGRTRIAFATVYIKAVSLLVRYQYVPGAVAGFINTDPFIVQHEILLAKERQLRGSPFRICIILAQARLFIRIINKAQLIIYRYTFYLLLTAVLTEFTYEGRLYPAFPIILQTILKEVTAGRACFTAYYGKDGFISRTGIEGNAHGQTVLLAFKYRDTTAIQRLHIWQAENAQAVGFAFSGNSDINMLAINVQAIGDVDIIRSFQSAYLFHDLSLQVKNVQCTVRIFIRTYDEALRRICLVDPDSRII